MPRFVPGAKLCRDFYAEVLAPELAETPHSAGLLGAGSEVLGYDGARSTDHDWAPRVSLFVADDQVAATRARVNAVLPDTFRGWPVRIDKDGGPRQHRVTVDTWPGWLRAQLGPDFESAAPSTVDWLLMPQQHLLGVVAGPVFADPDGILADTRRRLAWYPDDVWCWLLAGQWRRIAQEEPFVQRTAEVGDDLGSAVLAARLVRDAIRMALLIARRYAPYAKWLGTAFAQLPHPDRLDHQLAAVVAAQDLAGRERALSAAYESLAVRYLALPDAPRTSQLDPRVRPFYDRPALVLGADRFVADCLARITDRWLRELPLIGAVDQFADNTDLLTNVGLLQQLRPIYEPERSRPNPALAP
jgi:hypothetical protein